MGVVRVIGEDIQFPLELNAAGTKLVIVEFMASWYQVLLLLFISLF